VKNILGNDAKEWLKNHRGQHQRVGAQLPKKESENQTGDPRTNLPISGDIAR